MQWSGKFNPVIKSTTFKLMIGLALIFSLGVAPEGALRMAPTANAMGPANFAAGQTLAIPSYFYPAGPGQDLWDQIGAAYPTVGLAIINPNSGPGAGVNANYASQVLSSQAAGLTMIGYVHTSYGTRNSSVVEAEIDAYYRFYPTLNGIFLDEVSTDCVNIGYYSYLYDHIGEKPGRSLTVINPGTQTSECYVATSDIIVNFENIYTEYRDNYTQPAWVDNYPPTRFWHLVHTTLTIADMREAMKLSQKRNAGWIYVTPDVLPNPWDTLPANSALDSYWTTELTGARPRRTVWMYDFDSRDNATQVGFLHSMNINQVFLSTSTRRIDTASASYDAAYTSKLKDFVTLANSHGIRIHAMTLQAPNFTFPSEHANGVALVEHALAYNSAHPGATFDGIHIDTEPQALTEWDSIPGETDADTWSRREGLIQDFVLLLSQLRTAIDASGQSIEFSAALPWWFNENAERCVDHAESPPCSISGFRLPSGDATMLAQHLDVLVLMVFFDRPANPDLAGLDVDRLKNRSADEISETLTVIGINADGDFGTATYSEVDAILNALTDHFVGEANYLGTAVFKYEALKDKLTIHDCQASTTLEDLIECINDHMPAKETNGFLVPDPLVNLEVVPTVHDDWRSAVGQMLTGGLAGDCTTGITLPPSLSGIYELTEFTDTLGDAAPANDRTYCVLMEVLDADGNDKVDRGWGTFIVDPAAASELSIQVAHPKFDRDTRAQGIGVFKESRARSFLMAGTHRHANLFCSPDQPITCTSGEYIPPPLPDPPPRYLEADVVHNVTNLFQSAVEELQAFYAGVPPVLGAFPE